MFKKLFAAALATATLASAPAFAVTLTIGDLQVGCESSDNFPSPAPCNVGGTADLSNNVNAPSSVTFLGSGILIGYVLDADGVNANEYGDYALVTLTSKSIVDFFLAPENGSFDATFTFGSETAVVNENNDSLSYTFDAGTYLFGLDSNTPTNQTEGVSSFYGLSVGAIAPVPLPAGAVLLLTGLGGLAVARRKKAA